MRNRIKQWSTLHLGWPEAERCGLDVSLLFVHQQQRLVVCQTEILPCRHVSKSERLTPPNVTATPSGHRVSQWRQHTQLLQIHSKQNWDNKEKEKWKVMLVHREIMVREIVAKWSYFSTSLLRNVHCECRIFYNVIITPVSLFSQLCCNVNFSWYVLEFCIAVYVSHWVVHLICDLSIHYE